MGQQETPRNPPPIVRVPSYFSCYSIYIIQHNSIPDSALSPGSSLWRGQRPETPFSFPELRSFWPAPQIDAVGTSCMGTHIVSERIILKRWRTFSVHVSIASSKHSEELGEFSTVTPETQTRDAVALLSRILPTEKSPL